MREQLHTFLGDNMTKRVTFAITYLVFDNVEPSEKISDDDAIAEAADNFADDLPTLKVKDFGAEVEDVENGD